MSALGAPQNKVSRPDGFTGESNQTTKENEGRLHTRRAENGARGPRQSTSRSWSYPETKTGDEGNPRARSLNPVDTDRNPLTKHEQLAGNFRVQICVDIQESTNVNKSGREIIRSRQSVQKGIKQNAISSQDANPQKNRKMGHFSNLLGGVCFLRTCCSRCEKRHERASEDEQQSRRVPWPRRLWEYIPGSEDAHSERSLHPALMAALVTVAKRGKQRKCPSVGERSKAHTHTHAHART